MVAHLHPTSGTVTAIIHTPAEQFYVEPLFRHFNESCDSHMIAYKHSHLKFNLTGYVISTCSKVTESDVFIF